MNLQRTRISPDPRTKKSTKVLHAGRQKYIRVQRVGDDPKLLPRIKGAWYEQLEAFPYPWQQSQPHRLACHA